MTVTAGARLGPYEILAPLGAGGMGEVWTARDTRLDRIVAIKTTHGPFSERFEREARAISALNHPHICALYDVGEHDGAGFLVMELVEGAPLKGPLPLDQALKYGAQICAALDAAHRKGIVHRDLKPDNILVTKAGVKLLDFGLAKLAAPVAATATPTDAELAATKALTGQHIILGTPQYMAPEQIEGRDADARTDIFAFGCVLYELLTGQKAFDGKTPSSTMAAILATEPRPMRELQPVTPPALERIVKRCLAKDPDDRWQSARDLQSEIQWLASPASDAGIDPTALSPTPAGAGIAWVVAAAFAIAFVTVLWAPWRTPPPPPEPLQFPLALPTTDTPQVFALSPDGRFLSYALPREDGTNTLWLVTLSSGQIRAVAGTEGIMSGSCFSADGRTIIFYSGGALRRVETVGGPPQAIAALPIAPRGCAANRQGIIVVGGPSGLTRVSPDGTTAALTQTDEARQELDHTRPDFLPDGRHFVYLRSSRVPENAGIFVGSLDSTPGNGPARMLTTARAAVGAGIKYVPSSSPSGNGTLLFVRDGALLEQMFDANHLELSGTPTPVPRTPSGILSFVASDNGRIVHRSGLFARRQLTWVDRAGVVVGAAGDPGDQLEFNLSHDETRIASNLTVADNSDIWVLDVERGSRTRLTTDRAAERLPVWSPDGQQIAFTSTRGGRLDIYTTASNGAGGEKRLLETWGYPQDWSTDGRFLIYNTTQNTGDRSAPDLWVLPMKGDAKPIPYLKTTSVEQHARFSPDVRWVAYMSDESGRREVYVRPFPDASAGKIVISVGGGTQPRWRRDGKELYFLSQDNHVMAVDVTGSGASFRAGVPKPLFVVPRMFTANSGAAASYGHYFDVSSNGQRFLVLTTRDDERPLMTVMVNWQSAVKP